MDDSIVSQPLVVSGFHRSGTSLTMQALINAGLCAGDKLMPAHPSNPDGHFEDLHLVSLHQDMLRTRNRDWDTPGAAVTNFSNCEKQQARAIVDRLESPGTTWGFKDPRTCLFLQFWSELLPNSTWVFVYRHYLPCNRSLRCRQAQQLIFNANPQTEQLGFWREPYSGLNLWLDYNRAILDFIEQHDNQVLLISFDALRTGFDLPKCVNQRFNLKLDLHANSGIRQGSPSLTDKDSAMSSIPDALLDKLENTWQALQSRSDSETVSHSIYFSHPGMKGFTKTTICTTQLLDQLELTENLYKTSNTESYSSENNAEPRETSSQSSLGRAESLMQALQQALSSRAADNVSTLARQAASEFPSHSKLLLLAGRVLLNQKEYYLAEKYFKQAHKLIAPNPTALIFMGLLSERKQDHLKAIHLFELVTQQHPHNAANFFHLAKSQFAVKRFDAALQNCDTAIELDPANFNFKQLKLTLLSQSGTPDEIKTFGANLVAEYPDQPSIASVFSECLTKLHERKLSLKYFYWSVWLRIKANPEYRSKLLQAMGSIPSQTEKDFLCSAINEELTKLMQNLETPAVLGPVNTN